MCVTSPLHMSLFLSLRSVRWVSPIFYLCLSLFVMFLAICFPYSLFSAGFRHNHFSRVAHDGSGPPWLTFSSSASNARCILSLTLYCRHICLFSTCGFSVYAYDFCLLYVQLLPPTVKSQKLSITFPEPCQTCSPFPKASPQTPYLRCIAINLYSAPCFMLVNYLWFLFLCLSMMYVSSPYFFCFTSLWCLFCVCVCSGWRPVFRCRYHQQGFCHLIEQNLCPSQIVTPQFLADHDRYFDLNLLLITTLFLSLICRLISTLIWIWVWQALIFYP